MVAMGQRVFAAEAASQRSRVVVETTSHEAVVFDVLPRSEESASVTSVG